MIAVLGAGAFGTGLAIALSRAGNEVTLWARSAEDRARLAEDRENTRYVPGIAFSPRPSRSITRLRGCTPSALVVEKL